MALTKATYSMIKTAPVNIVDYGATGDGTTDDTAAIQAALDEGEGRIVFIPKGTYRITEQLNAPDRCQIIGESRDRCIIKYSGNTTIPGGAMLKFAEKSSFTVKNIGFRCTAAVLANNTIMLHLEDSVYFSVEDISFGGSGSASGQSSLIGCKCDQTADTFVPPRGSGVFRNILYVVEPPDAGSPQSAAIWVKGLPTQAMNHISFDGEGNLEHGHYAIRLENANNCFISNWQLRGSTNTEIALVNASSNTIVGPQIIPPPAYGVGISIDSNSLDNVIINPSWNFSSGNPFAAILDNGQRTSVIAPGAIASALQAQGKLNGSYVVSKADGTGNSFTIKRTTTDTDSGFILKSDAAPAANAWIACNRGTGPAGEDIVRLEGGSELFERVSSSGQRYLRASTTIPADGSLSLSQCAFYVNEAGNELKVKVKYSTGTVKIGTIALV